MPANCRRMRHVATGGKPVLVLPNITDHCLISRRTRSTSRATRPRSARGRHSSVATAIGATWLLCRQRLWWIVCRQEMLRHKTSRNRGQARCQSGRARSAQRRAADTDQDPAELIPEQHHRAGLSCHQTHHQIHDGLQGSALRAHHPRRIEVNEMNSSQSIFSTACFRCTTLMRKLARS